MKAIYEIRALWLPEGEYPFTFDNKTIRLKNPTITDESKLLDYISKFTDIAPTSAVVVKRHD